MYTHKIINVGKRTIDAFLIPLGRKNFILLRGSRGYCMCGYLNLSAARVSGDVAVRVSGVATIPQALRAKVSALTPAARKLGLVKGQTIRDVLKYIA